MRIRRRVTAAVVAIVAVAGVIGVAAGPGAAAPPARVELPGTNPPWKDPAAARGPTAASGQVAFRVYLAWRGAGAAERLAEDVSTPGSGRYRQFLAPEAFRAQFAPAASTVAAVRTWLTGAGLSVDYVPANRHYVSAAGTAAQANHAFGVTLTDYAVRGRVLRAPDRPLSAPAAVAGAISGVVGLDDTAALVHTNHAAHTDAPPTPAAWSTPGPCSAYWGEKSTATVPGLDGTHIPPAYGTAQPWTPCGYTPAQLQSAYGTAGAAAAGNDGHGQTVAVTVAYASTTLAADVATWSARRGLPPLAPGQLRQLTAPGTPRFPQNPAHDPQTWNLEETLDVEAVRAMAPGANIVVVNSPNNWLDLDAALNHIVDQHLADIVTNSWGWYGEDLPAGFVKPMNGIFAQAAATGVGMYFASGDSGDNTTVAGVQSPSPDWPASSPWVTAVGGTSLAVGAANNYLFETGWEAGNSALADGAWAPAPPGQYWYGSGGGTSRVFGQPAYQAGVVPDAMSKTYGGPPMRVVPDLAMVGDSQTGMLMGQTQTFADGTTGYNEFRIGGTSLSSPLVAGLLAVAQQRAGHPAGFINPTVYGHAGSAAFRDTQPASSQQAVVRAFYANGTDPSGGYLYRLRTLSYDTRLTIHTAAGYDAVTGVGTPNGAAFLAALSS